MKPRNTRAHWWQQVDMDSALYEDWTCKHCGKRWTERLFWATPGGIGGFLRFVSRRWACPGPVSHGDEWDTYG